MRQTNNHMDSDHMDSSLTYYRRSCCTSLILRPSVRRGKDHKSHANEAIALTENKPESLELRIKDKHMHTHMYLQHFVRRGFDTRWHVSWTERSLFDISKIVLRIFI